MKAACAEEVSGMLSALQLPLHGFCDFGHVADRLLPCRAASVLEGRNIRTMIMAAFPYACHDEDDGAANLARFARVPDYHTAAGNVLKKAAEVLSDRFPDFSFFTFIDNSPVPEVYAAACAGLGVIGRHGLLIHPEFGSWVVLGSILTDMELPAGGTVPAGCDDCGLCAEACPAGCIGGEKRGYCVSSVSQKKGALSPEEQALLKKSGTVWGCDICQKVCPANANAVTHCHPCFSGGEYIPVLNRDMLSKMEDRAFYWRGTAVLERNIRLFD